MEFIAEFLVELAGEIIMECGEHAVSNRRLPGWLRGLALLVFVTFYAAIFGIILLVGIGALSDMPWMSVLLFALDALMIFMLIHKFRKILRTLSQ